MVCCPRLMLPFAVVIGMVATLSMGSQVSAAEAGRGAGEVATAVAGAAPPVARRGKSRHARLNASRNPRYVGRIGRGLDCSGVWCGRQFVLMIGIAY